MSATKVLVVDDKQLVRDSVAMTLQRAGYQVLASGDGASALAMVARHRPAAVITDLRMPEMDGLELLARLRGADDQLPVVLMTAHGSIDVAVKAMKEGAFDFIQKPFENEQLAVVVKRACEHRRLLEENAVLRTSRGVEELPPLVGQSESMLALQKTIEQIASSHNTVLIMGESGTGKEVVARNLHARSPRKSKCLLAVNCAALSSSLLESELFGHEKGAFTGADQLRKGRFELADGGSLLLDEISEISPALQAKLLRILQERQFERVGSSLSIQVDVRVIATTNRDLSQSVARGEFRQDLFYRLNVLPLALPALRERREDIPLLAEHFLARAAQRDGREARWFEAEAMELMTRYPWPGNVRELQNICERACVLSTTAGITAELIGPWLAHAPAAAAIAARPGAVSLVGGTVVSGGVRAVGPVHAPAAGTADSERTPALAVSESVAVMEEGAEAETVRLAAARAEVLAAAESLRSAAAEPAASGASMQPGREGRVLTLEEVERQEIVRTLSRYSGNRARTAEALGIGLRTLGLKIKKWKEQKLVEATL